MKEIPNLSYIGKISRGNTLFEKNLIEIIKKELLNDIKTYHFHLKTKNFTKTAGDVHKLTHKIKIFGLERGCRIAEQYRANLLKNNLNLKIDFEAILSSLSLFIKKVQL